VIDVEGVVEEIRERLNLIDARLVDINSRLVPNQTQPVHSSQYTAGDLDVYTVLAYRDTLAENRGVSKQEIERDAQMALNLPVTNCKMLQRQYPDHFRRLHDHWKHLVEA
jgi:hypothetical protein